MKKSKGFSLIEIITVLVILGILLAIAVPNMMSYLSTTNVYRQEKVAGIITSTLKQEFIDYNGLTINTTIYDDVNHDLQTSIRTKLSLDTNSIIKFYGYGYANSNDDFKTAITTKVNEQDMSVPIYLIALPNHDTNGLANADKGTSALTTGNITLNLNYPIKMAIKVPNHSDILFYENGKQI